MSDRIEALAAIHYCGLTALHTLYCTDLREASPSVYDSLRAAAAVLATCGDATIDCPVLTKDQLDLIRQHEGEDVMP